MSNKLCQWTQRTQIFGTFICCLFFFFLLFSLSLFSIFSSLTHIEKVGKICVHLRPNTLFGVQIGSQTPFELDANEKILRPFASKKPSFASICVQILCICVHLLSLFRNDHIPGSTV